VADTFALDISKFIAKAKANGEQVVQKVGADVLASVVDKTPVGNPSLWKSKPPKGYVGGRLRANWNVSFGAPDISTTTTVDAAGSSTKSRGVEIIAQWDGQADIYVMNSLPYVRPIEYEGHSLQAPAGMVRITVAEFQTFVAEAVETLPK
jgi:hypothetical protein